MVMDTQLRIFQAVVAVTTHLLPATNSNKNKNISRIVTIATTRSAKPKNQPPMVAPKTVTMVTTTQVLVAA